MELLNFEEIKTLIVSNYSIDKAVLISSKLKDSLILHNEQMYVLKDNMTYEIQHSQIKDTIVLVVSSLIQKSHKKLDDLQLDLLKLTYPKIYKKILKNSDIESYQLQIMNCLKRKIDFDYSECEIHYNNGYMDLLDLQFKQRIKGKHYITNYIQRDYKKSTVSQQKDIMDIINMIYPNENDRKTMLLIMGSCLSGRATEQQDLLFLCGKGSSGKSFLMELTSLVIECYLKELKDDTFSQSNSKVDKILNSFVSNPQIRFTWINEPKDTKLDDSLFKSFCDGKLQTTRLYRDGSLTTKHYSKLFFTMNNLPNLKLDTGIKRRLKSLTHLSNFTYETNEINPLKHIYKRDDTILSTIIKKKLLDAWFDILSINCNSWLNGEKIIYDGNFLETQNTIICANDIFQDFIDSKLSKTNKSEDRIGKDEMHRIFHFMYPQKHLTVLQVITSLKDKGIIYQAKLRCDRIQGCFTNIKKFDELEDDFINLDNGLDHGLDHGLKITESNEVIENKKLFKANVEYLKKIHELEDIIKQLQPKIEIPKEIIVKEIIFTQTDINDITKILLF